MTCLLPQLPERVRFIGTALGIFIFYFFFGIVQEKITRGRYGQNIQSDGSVGERFTYAFGLVWVQCFFNMLFSKGLLMTKSKKEDSTNVTYYVVSALAYMLAMVSSTMALRWVSYPTQVVAKSAKPIPVMILGVLIGRKSYTLSRYACIITIVLGVIIFMYKDQKTRTSSGDQNILGDILLCFSLLMDGLIGAIQDRMRSSSSPSSLQMMYAMNLWSSALAIIPLIISGEIITFIQFAIKYPELFMHLAMLVTCGCIGQLFIFLMVANFGPLACSVVTTTRKFFTVLCSVLYFGNALSWRQWTGALIVFTGLFADIFNAHITSLSKKSTNHPKDVSKEKEAVAN